MLEDLSVLRQESACALTGRHSGVAAGAFTYGGFMVVQGFFIRVEDIGWWWRWMHWISMHSYAFSAVMYNEFDGREFTCNEPGRSMWPCVDG